MNSRLDFYVSKVCVIGMTVFIAVAVLVLLLAACQPITPTPPESPISPIAPPHPGIQAGISITGSTQVHWDDPTIPQGSGYYTVACGLLLEDPTVRVCQVVNSADVAIGQPVTCSADLSDCFGYRLYADVQLRTADGRVLQSQTIDTELGTSAEVGSGQYDGDIVWTWADFCGTADEWGRLRWSSGVGDTIYSPYHLGADGNMLPLDAQGFSKGRTLQGRACFLYLPIVQYCPR